MPEDPICRKVSKQISEGIFVPKREDAPKERKKNYTTRKNL